MTRTSKSGWMLESEKPMHPASNADFNLAQQGKPMKAVIGIAVLVVLSLILSRMNPVPHEIPPDPSMLVEHTTTEHIR